MKRRFLTGFAALLVLAATQSGLKADNFYMGGGDKDCEVCEKGCEVCSPSGGLYVGFEAAVLKPHMGSLGFSGLGHPSAQITPNFDYQFSPRIWVGWKNCEGLGVRATYWTFDADARTGLGPHGDILPGVEDLGIGLGLEAQTFDIEATQDGCWGALQFELSGGLRYGKMRTDLFASGTAIQGPEVGAGLAAEFEGIGPTIGLDVRRAIGSRGLSLVGRTQASWLYGTTDAFLTGELDFIDLTVTAEDHMMQVYEVGLGIEWATTFSNGNQLTAGLMWEAQAWEWSPVASLLHQDIGLSGPTFTVAWAR